MTTSHIWCQTKCVEFMEEEHPKIVIANTNTTEKEMQPYIDMANEYGYVIYYIIVEKRHNNKNDHNVPNETIERMKERFEISL
jgi:predicted kinase